MPSPIEPPPEGIPRLRRLLLRPSALWLLLRMLWLGWRLSLLTRRNGLPEILRRMEPPPSAAPPPGWLTERLLDTLFVAGTTRIPRNTCWERSLLRYRFFRESGLNPVFVMGIRPGSHPPSPGLKPGKNPAEASPPLAEASPSPPTSKTPAEASPSPPAGKTPAEASPLAGHAWIEFDGVPYRDMESVDYTPVWRWPDDRPPDGNVG